MRLTSTSPSPRGIFKKSFSLSLSLSGLGTLTVLEQYGEISGQSDTCAWHDQDWSSELMPIPAMGQEDMEQDGLSVKLDWIMELVIALK